MRECGLVPARIKFRLLLKRRKIMIKREIKDKHCKFDECIKPRIKAFELLLQTEAAYESGAPREEVKRLDEAHNDALDQMELAAQRRMKRVFWLHESFECIKQALTNK
jgi:hypothetical protein